jgi:hypothetical protein
MSVFKPFITSDVIVSPFKVNKSFTFIGTEFKKIGKIDRYLGKNITASLWVSGSNTTGYITSQSQVLVYRSIRELYYSNYLGGDDGAPAATASFNNDGTITGLLILQIITIIYHLLSQQIDIFLLLKIVL